MTPPAPAEPKQPRALDATSARFELVLRPEEAGQRLDKVLAARAMGPSRSTWQRWIQHGCVSVNGRAVEANTRLEAGARLQVSPPPRADSKARPQPIPLQVLFEDPELLVLDKPAGLVVHPAAGHPDGTLVNALLHHTGLRLPDAGDPAPDGLRPGIVHRLDKDTSGVMVVAKTPHAREALVAQFKTHAIERRYSALVRGLVPERLRIETLHARHPKNRKRYTSRTDRGRPALTEVERAEALHGSCLVHCQLHTGRTHQIRVHLAEHGHAVLGDPIYGRNPKDPTLRQVAKALGRQALHASVLGFRHPASGKALRFSIPLPDDMQRALVLLREART